MHPQEFLFFYPFFQAVRKRLGIELGLQQYTLFLEAISHRVGADAEHQYDERSLLTLCKGLWLTHQKYEASFEELYEEHVQIYRRTIDRRFRPRSGKNEQVDAEADPDAKLSPALDEPLPDTAPPLNPPVAPAPSLTDTLAYQEIQIAFEETDPLSNDRQQGPSTLDYLPEQQFIFSDKYFPFSERKLKQCWRYLKDKQVSKPSDQIDISATIQTSAAQKGNPTLVYQQEKYFDNHFIFLIDRGPTMVAFEKFSQFVVDTFYESVRPSHFQKIYFRDLSSQRFYQDFYLSHPLPTNALLKEINRGSYLFIFSDGQVGRGEMDHEFTLSVNSLLEQIKQRSSHVLWLNPFPKERWMGTAALYISLVCPMMALTEKGINKLPDLLKHL